MRLLSFLFLLLCAVAAPAAAADNQLRPRLEALSAKGSGEAAYHLGMIHHLGLEGTPKNAQKAFELFKLAMERGDPLGAYKLGCFYAGQGEGVVEDDPGLALKYKLVAAEAGYSLAQTDVARHYAGQGKTDEALRWMEAAARQGDFGALMALGALYSGAMPDLPAPVDRAKGYAYSLAAFSGAEPGSKMEAEMAEMRNQVEAHLSSNMSTDELKRGRTLLAQWKPDQSELDRKAGIGLEAARKLVALNP